MISVILTIVLNLFFRL
nr:hypothetical protein [Megasphaera massiliensis]